MTEKNLTVIPSKQELQKKLKVTLKGIDKKLEQLGVGTSATYKALPNFKYNELDSNTVNIQTSADVVYLGKCLALMIRVKKEYEEVFQTLGVKTYPTCTWLQHPVDNWVHDLEIRIKQVVNAAHINKLVANRTRLQNFLSEEEQLYNTLLETSDLVK